MLASGAVDAQRIQKWVQIHGRIENFYNDPYNPFRLTCTCLLSPPSPRVTPGFWCRPDCPVRIERREYVNCTQLEVAKRLVDFTAHGLNDIDMTFRPDPSHCSWSSPVREIVRGADDIFPSAVAGWGESFSQSGGWGGDGETGGWGGDMGSSQPSWAYIASSD